MGGQLHLVQQGGDWARLQQMYQMYLAVPNVSAHPSTASVQITVLLHNGLLLCGFNVPIKGFKISDYQTTPVGKICRF